VRYLVYRVRPAPVRTGRLPGEGAHMATGKETASKASEQLQDDDSTKDEKSVAASDLAQADKDDDK
jgi:hypothetical protein